MLPENVRLKDIDVEDTRMTLLMPVRCQTFQSSKNRFYVQSSLTGSKQRIKSYFWINPLSCSRNV